MDKCITIYLWKNLRKDNAYKIRNFILSRTFRIHQEHANLFLNLYCPKIVHEVKGINYWLFLDLIVKSVVDFQDGKLVMRIYKPGKQCVWNNSRLYFQYLNPNGTQVHPNNRTHHLLPEEIQFRRKHPNFQFHHYNVAVNEYNCFSMTDRYVPRNYIP